MPEFNIEINSFKNYRLKKSLVLSLAPTGLLFFDTVKRKKILIEVPDAVASAFTQNGYAPLDAFENLGEGEAQKILQICLNKNWLESIDVLETSLNEREKARFRRQADYFSAYQKSTDRWNAQRSLRDKTIAVIGLGGSGSNIAFSLAAVGIGRLLLVDDDVVDLSNMNRSYPFIATDEGKKKTEALLSHILDFNPSINVEILNKRLTAESNFNYLRPCDLIINCADKPSIRETTGWLLNGFEKIRPPIMVGPGYFLDYGQIGPLIPDSSFPCLECGRQIKQVIDSVAADAAKAGGSFGPNVLILANLCCREVVGFLTGSWIPFSLSTLIVVDFRKDEKKYILLKKNPRCRVCSDFKQD